MHIHFYQFIPWAHPEGGTGVRTPRPLEKIMVQFPYQGGVSMALYEIP